MHFSTVARSIVLLAAAAVSASTLHDRNQVCNANNCARAVTGTREGRIPSITSRRLDCSSFMLVTVTLAPTTTTLTETVSGVTTITITTTLSPANQARRAVQGAVTIRPTSIPPYASPCPNSSAFSSACSCWGIGPMKTTAAASTVTATTTVTAVATNVVVVDECNSLPYIGCGQYLSTSCRSGTGSCACLTDSKGLTFCAKSTGGCSSDRACAVDSDCAAGWKCTAPDGACCGFSICMLNSVGDCFGSTGQPVQRLTSLGPAQEGSSELIPHIVSV
ncbi:hypothetical protein B0T11DRAFT_6787 [Plectosphaerella cucumerina]|uniref:Antifreeze protein n=1 Tax=Plectosphaerella cucumerina TaxID=40658 RepID=A0A8K0TUS8_9PEZI|nr:hypothetical protein B0T11DRAFT_6787 [Plectosphaerella cucumerina]